MTRLDTQKPKDCRKVAVIGSGLAGLTTAYLLRQEGVEVWLIEKSDRLGFHSASVHIPVGNDTSRGNEDGVAERSGSTKLAGPQKRTLQAVAEEPSWAVDVPEKDEWVVDVPMRSFQGGYYPLLISLYHHLGLPLIPCDFTFSFSRLARSSPARSGSSSSDRKLDSDDTYTHQTYFLHSGSSGLAFPALPSAALTSPLSFFRHTLRFLITAVYYLLYLLLCFLVYHSILSRSRPFSAYITSISYRLNYPVPLLPLPSTRLGNAFRSFAHDVVLPLFSAVGTMSAADVLEMPMGIMADYVHTTVGTTHWRLSADTGAREVARRLVKVVKDQGEGHALIGTELRGLHAVPGGEGVKVVYAGGELQVDTVILATPAKVAEKLLGGLTKSMQANEGMAAASEMKRLEVARKALRAVRQTVCPVSSYDLPRWVLAQRELIKKETIVVTHRDTSILPSSPHDVKDIDLLQPLWPTASSSTSTTSDQREVAKRALAHSAATFPSEPTSLQEAYTSGTHLIRPPAHFASQAPVLQTTNPIGRIDTGHILAEARLERALPIHDPITLADLSIPADLMGTAPLVVIAGAYAYPGIPLLEGCVGSAVRATQAILRTGADADGATAGRKASSLAPTSIVDPGFRLGGVDWTAGLGGKWGRMWRARRSRVGEVF